MADLYLPIEIQFNVLGDYVVDHFYVSDQRLDTSFDVEFIPVPGPFEEFIDVDLFVEDIPGMFSFAVDPDRFIVSDFNSDGKLLDCDYEYKWPETRYPVYEGSYEIEPRKVEQKLDTYKRSMEAELTVLPIRCVREKNSAGGYTVTIGRE